MKRGAVPGTLTWLIAAAFLLVQAAAFAHEFEHELHKHDGPCALHYLADHTGKPLPAFVDPASFPIPSAVFVDRPSCLEASATLSVYAARAPPAVR